MIAGLFHEGSGLGDQLFRYITVRTLAEKKGYDWGMVHPENFKGKSFMNLQTQYSDNFYTNVPLKTWNEKEVRENGADIRSYDPEINFVEDNTVIDGSFEDSKYWGKNLSRINEWLKVEPLSVPDDTCVLGFRGGEYAAVPELFLGPDYYEAALKNLPGLKYQVHTDDPNLAKQLFPSFEVIENQHISHSKHTNMGFNWRSARFAKHAIIPNSAFFILPRLLKHQEDPEAVTIAPQYWAGRNVQQWRRPACFYPEFTYV